MAPAVNKTLAVLAVAGAGALAYAVYFDHKRRTDASFRKKLRREKKKVDKTVAQTASSAPASESGLGDLGIPSADILAAMQRVKDDQVPNTPEEREQYFMSQVEKGEELCAKGPDFAVEAALAFFRALRVYPSPVELIMIFQNTVPEPIFKLVLEMMRLDVSDPSLSADTDEAPLSAVVEEDESTSNRGPPSEASSQDWDRVKGRVEGYFDVFPPKSMNVSTKTIEIADANGATVLKRILVADKDFSAGELIYKERPIVSALDSDLRGKGTHCSHCLRQISDGEAIKAEGDPLDSVFCSPECLTKLKTESQTLLFGPEYAIPVELNPNQDPESIKAREDAQAAFARFIKESGRAGIALAARFIARQVVNETAKLLPAGHPAIPAHAGEWTADGYTLFDHMERVRFLELTGKEDEAAHLRAILKANLQGLEDFVTDERYTVLLGKMAYNAYGVSFDGGRDDKPPFDLRPEDVELTRTPAGTARQVGSGLYIVSSYISHSCDPSALPTFPDGTSEMHLVAARDLKAGDELTVAYVDCSVHADEDAAQARYRRRKELARGWRFACPCERCAREAPAPAAVAAGEKAEEPELEVADGSKVEAVVGRVDREEALAQTTGDAAVDE
ncbi:MAS20-domain-containing protein [Gloeopeniophorella convolvens]|nr:MAS20-domain-containing protein [Gloeopeniophorella convolvens]